jgi:hypothetical protein
MNSKILPGMILAYLAISGNHGHGTIIVEERMSPFSNALICAHIRRVAHPSIIAVHD